MATTDNVATTLGVLIH